MDQGTIAFLSLFVICILFLERQRCKCADEKDTVEGHRPKFISKTMEWVILLTVIWFGVAVFGYCWRNPYECGFEGKQKVINNKVGRLWMLSGPILLVVFVFEYLGRTIMESDGMPVAKDLEGRAELILNKRLGKPKEKDALDEVKEGGKRLWNWIGGA